MTSKTISRFFSIQQAFFGTLMLIIAIVWPVWHLIQGTMNGLGAIYSIAMLGVSAYLCRLAWIELLDDFKKDKTSNSK